jgi:hypothetical protein
MDNGRIRKVRISPVRRKTIKEEYEKNIVPKAAQIGFFVMLPKKYKGIKCTCTHTHTHIQDKALLNFGE